MATVLQYVFFLVIEQKAKNKVCLVGKLMFDSNISFISTFLEAPILQPF
jgi:hypothetical protein